MKQYSYRQYGCQPRSYLTLRLNVKEVQVLSELANRYGLPRHTIITRALKRGLPLVIANLEARAATNKNNGKG